MNILENAILAIAGLWANKMRALLTMLGIIIGIGSVIAIVMVGDSVTNSLNENMQELGANNITVLLKQRSDDEQNEIGNTVLFKSNIPDKTDLITEDMINEYYEVYQDDIKAISRTKQLGTGKAKDGERYSNVSITGANAGYFKAETFKLLNGRLLTEKDSENSKNIAVVSDKFVQNMFGEKDPIGQRVNVTVQNQLLQVFIVGVYEYKQSQFSFSSANDQELQTAMVIPLNAAIAFAGGERGMQNFTIVSNVGVDTSVFMNQTKTFFQNAYRNNRAFTIDIFSMETMLDTLLTMLTTVQTAIAVIAGISLMVGGIGVMNIMLVSITERTKEIGTRKALGATNGSIRIQFIVESVIICLVGGIIGIMIGIGGGTIGAMILGYPAAPALQIIIISVLFSMAIGVFFGYYPANKAALLDPIEALRYE